MNLAHFLGKWGPILSKCPIEKNEKRWSEHQGVPPEINKYENRWSEHQGVPPKSKKYENRWSEHQGVPPKITKYENRWPVHQGVFVVYISFVKKVAKGPIRTMMSKGSSTRLGEGMGGHLWYKTSFYMDLSINIGPKRIQNVPGSWMGKGNRHGIARSSDLDYSRGSKPPKFSVFHVVLSISRVLGVENPI